MTKNLEIIKLLDIYSPLLTKRQKQIAEDYFSFDLSLGEISLNYGITRQAASDALKSAKTALLKFDSALNLSEIKNKILQALDESLSPESRLNILKDVSKFF